MPFSLRRLRQAHFLTLIVLVCFGIAVFSVNKLGWFYKAPMPAASAQVKDPKFKKPQVELLTLRPTGIDPAEITRPHAPFYLVVQNSSGKDDLSFRFDKEVGAKLRNPRIPVKKREWSELVDLPPGTYKMTEANHPGWAFTLTITTEKPKE